MRFLAKGQVEYVIFYNNRDYNYFLTRNNEIGKQNEQLSDTSSERSFNVIPERNMSSRRQTGLHESYTDSMIQILGSQHLCLAKITTIFK